MELRRVDAVSIKYEHQLSAKSSRPLYTRTSNADINGKCITSCGGEFRRMYSASYSESGRGTPVSKSDRSFATCRYGLIVATAATVSRRTACSGIDRRPESSNG